MNQKYQIKCTHCLHNIDVSEAIYDNIAEGIKNDVVNKMVDEKKQFESKLRKQISEEKDAELVLYKEELDRKSQEVKDFNRIKAELERAKREKSELKEKIESELELRMTNQLNEERNKIKKEADEKSFLKVAEKEHIIEQLKEQLSIAQRKAEQGSMQLQGEVQELVIEEILESTFRFDLIQQIKPGERGGDCFQTVVNPYGQHCGKILFESKRTKSFSSDWIEKIKNDMQIGKADIGVIVTETFPKDMEKLGLKDGVWIIGFSDVKSVALLLREGIIKIHEATLSQENKGSKMEMLYNFLTSNEFKMQIEAIVDTFSNMQTDLNKERRAMEGHWKKREKQIEKVLLNTSHMFNTVKGIAGESVGTIHLLELPEH